MEDSRFFVPHHKDVIKNHDLLSAVYLEVWGEDPNLSFRQWTVFHHGHEKRKLRGKEQTGLTKAELNKLQPGPWRRATTLPPNFLDDYHEVWVTEDNRITRYQAEARKL